MVIIKKKKKRFEFIILISKSILSDYIGPQINATQKKEKFELIWGQWYDLANKSYNISLI